MSNMSYTDLNENKTYTQIVVKKGNGKPSKDQIKDAVRAANPGQIFAVASSFDEDANAAILIDDNLAGEVKKHADDKGFEIHNIPKVEDEPDEPGESNESFNESLLEYGLDENDVNNLLEAFKHHENNTIRNLGEILEYEIKNN